MMNRKNIIWDYVQYNQVEDYQREQRYGIIQAKEEIDSDILGQMK